MMLRRILIALAFLTLTLVFPQPAFAASLYLSPSSTTKEVDANFNISLGVNTQGVAINSAQAVVSFSNDLLEVTSISQNGVFTLWPVSPSFSNAAGTVTFAGGLPSPGLNGSRDIITISFRAKAAGTASVSIGSGSVLANDGFGTDVLLSQGSATITITEPAVEPPPPEEPDLDLPGNLTITSSSHPEQALWYANSNPEFSWNKDDGVVGFSYVFDDQSDTIPDRTSDGGDAVASYSDTGDGVWYFHARAQNNDGWGPTSHHQVQIDTTPPLPFSINLIDGKITIERSPRIGFETTDATSGIHHYDLIIDDESPIGIDVSQSASYTLNNLNLGLHNVTAIAYDQARNSQSASNSFTIITEGDPSPIVVEEIDEADKSLAEKIIDTLNSLIPAPIKDITEAFSDIINDIKNNEAIVEIIDTVIEPILTITAIVAATSLATAIATTINIYNLMYLFFRFGYFWLVPITMGKKRKRWGTVFDSITGKPVARAVVRIFSREFNKLKESQITDSEGRFGFLVDKGSYYVTVMSPGYVFPSHVMKTSSISQYDDIYRGNTLEITEKQESVLSMNIPIDPNTKTVSPTRLKWLKIISLISFVLEKISMPLLVIGTFLSWIVLIIQPKTANYFILLLYGALIISRYIVTKKFGKSVGMVRNKITEQPIESAIVRIYNADTSSMASTRVTNTKGQFNSLLAPGKYYLVIVKQGYEKFQSRPVNVSKYRGYIRFTASLRPVSQDESHLDVAHDQDVNIQLEEEPGSTPVELKYKESQVVSSTEDKKKIPDMPDETLSSSKKKRKSTSKNGNKKPPTKPPAIPPMPGNLGDLSRSGQDS